MDYDKITSPGRLRFFLTFYCTIIPNVLNSGDFLILQKIYWKYGAEKNP